jgi:hypothetical protein
MAVGQHGDGGRNSGMLGPDDEYHVEVTFRCCGCGNGEDLSRGTIPYKVRNVFQP